MFHNLKQFIAYLCQETGLTRPTAQAAAGSSTVCGSATSTATSTAVGETNNGGPQAQNANKTYLLMLDDAILLNMDSIQENDRLSLIAADALQEFVKGKDEERRQESLERQRLKAAQLLQNEARQAELDLQ